jgi:aconitate hydratase
MGQAPATGRISLRTVPRNVPGRSGTIDDQVYLYSPETAAALTLTGVITDPRTLHMPYLRVEEPERLIINTDMWVPPPASGTEVELVKGPNIQSLPALEPLPDSLEGPVLIKLGDNISTDEIMPAGEPVLPYRGNIAAISTFVFRGVDPSYYERAMRHRQSGSFIVGGRNYGQGLSREHAAIGPRYLGVKAALAKTFARIHRQNLINFGILSLTFANPDDWNRITPTTSLPKACKGLGSRSMRHRVLRRTAVQAYVHAILYPITRRLSGTKVSAHGRGLRDHAGLP